MDGHGPAASSSTMGLRSRREAVYDDQEDGPHLNGNQTEYFTEQPTGLSPVHGLAFGGSFFNTGGLYEVSDRQD